jgi:two-component system, NtrC family, sensor kinase
MDRISSISMDGSRQIGVKSAFSGDSRIRFGGMEHAHASSKESGPSMSTKRFRKHVALVLSVVAALAVASLGVVSLVRAVETFQPAGFSARATGGGWTVGEVFQPETGLAPGDQVLLAGGEPTDSLGERLRRAETTELVVLRGDELVEVLYRRPPLDVDWPYLILAFIGSLYLLIGIYTAMRERRAEAWLFYLWCLASAGLYLVTPTSLTDGTGRLLHVAEELARALLPPLTLHLFLIFPRRMTGGSDLDGGGGRSLRWAAFLYLPAAVLLTLQAALIVGTGRWLEPAAAARLLPVLDRASLIHLVLFAFAALAVLALRLARHREWEERRQLQWIAVGLGVGYVPFLLLYVLPYTVGSALPRPVSAAAVLPLALVPIAFSWAILRYRLWDLGVVLRETASTALTVLLAAGAFALAHLAVTRGVPEEMGLARNFLTFGSGVVIAGLLVPTRRQVGSALERLQYGRAMSKRRALSRLGRELLLEKNLERLCHGLLDDLIEAVELDGANLYLAGEETLHRVVPDDRIPDTISLGELGDEIWERELEGLSGVSMPGRRLGVRQRLFIAGYRYAFPLTVRGGPVGLLITTFRVGEQPLSSDDLELVRQVTGGAALAIENARLFERLQRQLEETVHLQRFNQGIIESSPAGMAVLASDGRIVSTNAAFAGLAERSREALVGVPVDEALPVEPLPAPGDRLVEVSFCDAKGRERHLQVSVASFADADAPPDAEAPLRVLVVYDVSDRVAMERSLREKDRLAALGVLAAGVAHEVNTPITGISSYAQMLLSETPVDDPKHEILRKVERQTFRAARIVNNLLDFARKKGEERSPVDLGPLVEESLDLLAQRRTRKGVALELRLPADPLEVLGDDGELQQVLTNLALNAIDAMDEGDESRGGTLTLEAWAQDGRARVALADTGRGMTAGELERIFEPFYSTKMDRGGTGLGLAISKDIVERHGGTLTAESEPGVGTRFVIDLPLLGSDAPPAGATGPAEPSDAGLESSRHTDERPDDPGRPRDPRDRGGESKGNG